MQRTERPRRRLSTVRKLVFATLPLIALLVGAEVVCRFLPHGDVGETLSGFVEPDPELIWRLTPTSSGPLATNELGFRDTPHNAAAEHKILLLGDSVAWGDGMVDLRDVFPYRLEQRLNERAAPGTFEVINSGVPGYSTFQQADYLRSRGLELRPDLVLLQFCLNDVVERYETLAAYGGDNVFLGVDTRRHGGRGAFGWLLAHSRAFERLLRWMQWRSRSREAYEVRLLAVDEPSAEIEEAWSRTLSEIDDIRSLCEAQGIPFLLVVAPYRFQVFDSARTRQPQDRLLAYAREREVRCIDLLPELAGAGREQPMFDDESHFSAEGHRVVADRLVEPVLEALQERGAAG